MHDINNLERRGLPSMFIASTEFIPAAEAQSKALGFRPMSVFVQHPIQDRTDDELHALADAAFSEIVSRISDV